MTEKRETWEVFRKSGLLWWVNRAIHLFGWALIIEIDDHGTVKEVYPARCSYRGFPEAAENRGFQALTHHIAESAGQLQNDVRD